MLSVVIPVFNEDPSLAELHGEIVAAAARGNIDLEIIIADDGSTDGTWATVLDLCRKHRAVRGVRLRRNFGKAAALSAGFKLARGYTIITLDGDLQDDPAEIPNFLAALDKGLDVVSGWKQVRLDPWHKVWPSRAFNWMVSRITGVRLHDHNCGMKCYRTEVLREVRLYGELHRFIPVLAAARGFRIGELAIKHRPRRHGRSKYGMRRFIKGFLDLLTVKFLTSFSHRPQHVLGSIGLLSFLAGNAGLLYLAVIWVINFVAPGSYPPLHVRPLMTYSVAALLMGVQLLSVGLIAELFTAFAGRDEQQYSVAAVTDDPTEERVS